MAYSADGQPPRAGAALTQPEERRLPNGELPPIDPLDTRRYFIAIRRLADTLSHGTDRSRFLGAGLEYVQSRLYVPGDPVRAIDWRVTARAGEVHIKEYEAPKRMPAWLLFDTSASMTYSSTPRSKYAVAAQAAGGLAFALLDRVSPVGMLGTGEREIRVQPSLSKDEVMQWLVKLRKFHFGEQTTLTRRLTELNARLSNKALVIVFSDMHEEGAVDALKLMAQVHDVVCLQFVDPAELGIRGAGIMRAEEAETGETFVTHGRRALSDPDEIKTRLQRGGIDHLAIRTDQPFAQTLRMFFATRGALSGGKR